MGTTNKYDKARVRVANMVEIIVREQANGNPELDGLSEEDEEVFIVRDMEEAILVSWMLDNFFKYIKGGCQ